MCSCVTFRAFLRISCDVFLFTLCLSPLWHLILSALCICVFCILLYDVCIVQFCVLCLHVFCTASMYFLCSVCTVSVHFLHRVCVFSVPCLCNLCAVSVHSLCWLSYWLSSMLFYLSGCVLDVVSWSHLNWIDDCDTDWLVLIVLDCFDCPDVTCWLIQFDFDLTWFDLIDCLVCWSSVPCLCLSVTVPSSRSFLGMSSVLQVFTFIQILMHAYSLLSVIPYSFHFTSLQVQKN